MPKEKSIIFIQVIFGTAGYGQPKVYEAGFLPRGLLAEHGPHLTPMDLGLQPGNAMSWRLCLPLGLSLPGKTAYYRFNGERLEPIGKVTISSRLKRGRASNSVRSQAGDWERERPPVPCGGKGQWLAGGSFIHVIFGVAEYDRPKVYEAVLIARSLLRDGNGLFRSDTPKYAGGSFIQGNRGSRIGWKQGPGSPVDNNSG